nr:MAG: hypothetical protein 1 [Hangzhou picorna-like virus 2]
MYVRFIQAREIKDPGVLMTFVKCNLLTIKTMQDKRKLNNGAETIAVTSFLSFTYKPYKQVHAFDDYTFPPSMCSKRGHLDTSKRFIKIGGGEKMFLTNNHYGDYGKYLKQKHVKMNTVKQCSSPCDSRKPKSDAHDAKQADNAQQIDFLEPKIKKEFVYRRDRKLQKEQKVLDKNDFLRTDEEGLKIIQKNKKLAEKREKLLRTMYATSDDETDDEVGFWDNHKDSPKVQGFDEKTKQIKVEKQVQRFAKLNTTKESVMVNVIPSTVELNERNQVAEQIRKNLRELQKEIDELNNFKITIEEQLRNAIQGGTFSSVNKVNDIINTAHHEFVEKKTFENASTVFNSLGTLSTALQSIVDAVATMLDSIRSYIDSILNTLNSINPIASKVLEILGKSILIHFTTHFISKMCLGVDLSLLDFIGVLYAVLLKSIFHNDRSWGEMMVTTCLCVFANTWCVNRIEKVRVESKDLFVIPFSICLGMGLLASGKHSFCENFIGSIKGFGGILSFSSKCDSVLRGIVDIVPQVFVEYFRSFFPRAYEYMILGWKDQEFQKDLQDLIKLISEPETIYYSSHKVKLFLDLVGRFKDVHIKRYGHFSFFSTSPIFDKVDCIYEEVKRRGLIPGRRHCPYVVWIAGDSGVGKSSLAQHLASQFIDKEIEYSKQVYTWNPVLEFQDGYNHQPVVIINDYMQTTDHGEEQILISIKDACDWMLNSSSTDDIVNGKKGEMRFTSKLIIITSNVTYLHSSNYIRETHAFNRRRDLLIEMKFKGKQQFNFENPDYSWCAFALKDPCVDGIHARQSIKGVSELIQIIERGYKAHYDRSLDRVLNGLKIQGEDDDFEDAPQPGFLKNIIINKLKEWKEVSIHYLEDHYKSILLGLTIFGVSAFTLAKVLMKMPSIQAFNSGDSNTVVKMHPKVLERFKAQSETEDHDQKQFRMITANMYRVSTCILIENRSTIRSVTGVYLGNDVMLLPKHLFYRGTHQMQPGEMIIVNKGNILYETTFEKDRLTMAGEDYCFYNVHLIMPRQKNISHLFDNGIEPMDKETTCTVLRLDPNGSIVDNIIVQGYFVPSVTCYDDVAESSQEYIGKVMIRARAELQSGDCGALIGIRVGGNFRLFGIHVGGLNGVNYFQLTNVRNYVKNKDRVIPIKGFIESADFEHKYGQFIIQGDVASSAFPYSNNQTKITPSICYEILQPHTTEPAVLSLSDPRNPERQSMLHNGTIAIGKILKPINSNNFDELLQYMRKRHRCLYGDYRLLTLSESINGIDGLDRIDFTTSPGYPYTVSSQGVSFRKTDFFIFNGKIWEQTQAFQCEFKKFIEDSKRNGIPIIWTNCVKDERRPKEKILKSRIFTISNIMLTVLGRQIFGQYVERYSRMRHEHGGMIGINPYSSEWGLLFDHLNQFRNANDGDFSKFDKDLLKEVFQLFARFIKEIIPDSDLYGMSVHNWIDEILYCALFSDTLTILDGRKVLVTSLHGNPSGWFLTVFFNDFANKIYIYSVWQRLFKYELSSPDLRIHEYLNNVRDVYYGDDNLYTVSDKYKDRFNAAIIAEQLLDMYNITYTSGDKSAVVSYNKPLVDCTFLKNHFVNQSGIIVAGLDKNTIQEMVSWTRDKDKSLQQILETSLRYSYFWGFDYFNHNRNKLLPFSTKLPTYQELDFEFRNSGGLNFELYSKIEEQRYLELLHKINTIKMSNKRNCNESGLASDVKISGTQIKIQSKDEDISHGLRDNNVVTEELRNYGVSMVNQNIREEHKLFNKASRVQIPEVANNLKSLLSRPLLVRNVEVPANTLGPVTSLIFPQDWVNVSRNVADIANAYFLFKGKIKIQATLQSTPFNAGTMVVHASYKDISSFDTGNLLDVENAWLRPHCELDYSDNAANVIMDIPWKYKREYCDFSATGADGIVDILFDNYLPNTSTARLMVYMWIEDADVVVTRTIRPVVQGITLFGDSITNVVTNQQIGEVAGNVMPNNIKGDQFDTNASLNLSALDQPNLTLEPCPATLNREPFSSNAVQIQHKEKLALYPKEQMLSTFDTFGTDRDEMSIDYLKSKWSLGGLTFPTSPAIKYSTTTSPYTVLAAGCVGPYGGSSMAYNNKSVQPYFTFLDYISKNHTLWRGSRGKDGVLEYRFKFACNRFQSGRVAVAYNPIATWQEFFGTWSTTSPTIVPDQLGSCYVAYFDINGQDNEIIVRLPYVSATPWKVCWTGMDSDCPLNSRQSIMRNSFAGIITLVAITPLVSPVGSPTEINIASFIRGAPGYQIAANSVKNNAVGFYQNPLNRSDRITVNDTNITTKTSSVNPALLEKLRVQSNDIETHNKKKNKIRVDCWEILRQLIRVPKVEFELPYYQIKEEIHVQSTDYVFLGEEMECPHGDTDIQPTTSLRDMMKKMVLTGRFATPMVGAVLNYTQGGIITDESLELVRVYTIQTVPVFPFPGYRQTQTSDLRVPSWYNIMGMYQGYRGGFKMRVRVCVDRTSIKQDDEPSLNRTINPFHCIVFLDDAPIGTLYGELGQGTRSIESLPLLLNTTNFSNHFISKAQTHDHGILAMESNISNEIDIDFEVPAHLFNKYHEVDRYNHANDPNESRPLIRIYVYQDIMVKTTDSSPHEMKTLLDWKPLRNAIFNTQIKTEVFTSISDEGRCGVLDEYPRFVTNGTDIYISSEGLPTQASVALIPSSTYP